MLCDGESKSALVARRDSDAKLFLIRMTEILTAALAINPFYGEHRVDNFEKLKVIVVCWKISTTYTLHEGNLCVGTIFHISGSKDTYDDMIFSPYCIRE